ncbi:Uncharacterised protein [Vibrio cholerae]|nr:Uncharacterised protein [Vibrio cholerae]
MCRLSNLSIGDGGSRAFSTFFCHRSGRYFGKTCVTKRREHHFACDGLPEWVRSSHVG